MILFALVMLGGAVPVALLLPFGLLIAPVMGVLGLLGLFAAAVLPLANLMSKETVKRVCRDCRLQWYPAREARQTPGWRRTR